MSTSLLNLIKSLGDIHIEDIESWSKDYQFQGLNLEELVSIIARLVTDDAELKIGLKKLIFIGLIRGNNVTKMVKSMVKEKADEVTKLGTKFGIFDSITKAANRNTALTLSRLRLALPQIGAIILNSELCKRPVSTQRIKSVFGIPDSLNFPLVFRDLSIASLIPENDFNGWTNESLSSCITCITGYCYLESLILDK